VLPAEPAPGSVYGPLHQYSAAACVPGRLAALGSATGGSHGMARTSNWYAAGGPLREVISAAELYGGSQSIAVNRLAGGPAGWVIAGAREDANSNPGAAVWVSPDAVEFTLVDGDPALESRTGEITSATDATWDGHGWTLVGDRTVVKPGGAGRTAMAWTSQDGRTWTRQYAPAAGAAADALQRVVPYRGGVLALGLHGNQLGAWRRDAAGRWSWGGAFGHTDVTRGKVGVQSLAVAGDVAYAAVTDGTAITLWTSHDGTRWRRLAAPAPLAGGADNRLLVASDGTTVMAATDDALLPRLFTLTP
jgi:hypothetical protein